MTVNGWDLPGAYNRRYNFKHDPTKTWSGTYFTDQGQVVTAEDAGALADALERALGGSPNHVGPTRKVIEIDGRDLEYSSRSPNEVMSIAAELLRHLHERAREAAVFCRKGAFRIR